MRGISVLVLSLLLTSCGEESQNQSDADTETDPPVDTLVDFVDGSPDTVTEDPPEDIPVETATDPVEELPPGCDRYISTFEPGQTVAMQSGGPAGNTWSLHGSISEDFLTPPVSVVRVESLEDRGGPFSTGTTYITEWAGTSDCSLCIWLEEDCESSVCAREYIASSATLIIDEIDVFTGGVLDAMLLSVVLNEWDRSSNTLVPDGLTYCIDIWDIDETFH